MQISSLPLWERGLKSLLLAHPVPQRKVAPLVGAWIEMSMEEFGRFLAMVAPLVGAWIEIALLPRRWQEINVAPLVGAWIEIEQPKAMTADEAVAPLVGAWIEIRNMYDIHIVYLSLPLWERGLKYFADGTEYMVDYVAPLVGAWIEMDLWDV